MEFYNYKAQSGLKIIFLKKQGFSKKFCGIGTKYGGSNLEYILNGEKIRTKAGIAHFIEHKLFQMPDGSDAFKTFTDLYTSSNAYTANDKTIYYYKTLDEFYTPLELLLKMYFTPYFTKTNVELEKEIIISEINMYKDDIESEFYQKSIEAIYPNDDYSKKITGEVEDVNNTTDSDLLNAYKAFYTPNNSVMVVVGDLDENILFNKIEEILFNLNLNYSNVKKEPFIKSVEILPPAIIEEDTSVDELNFMLRIDELDNTDPILCEKLIGIIDSVVNISTDFNKSLVEEGLYDGELDYQVVTHSFGSYILFSAVSKYPEKLAEKLMDKLNNLSMQDINLIVLNLYIKSLKTKILLKEDSIDFLGDDILSLALEDIDYEVMLKKTLKLKADDFIPYIKNIINAKKTYLILKSKNN